MVKGDIILIPFPFTDLSGNKYRPALILSTTNEDITVSFITTQLHWKEETDITLIPTNANGLKKESIIRLSKIATLSKTIAIGRLGNIDTENLKLVNRNLKKIFELD